MATVISESPNGHEAAEPDRADGVSDPPAPLSSGNWPGVIGTQPFEILTWAGNELERDGTGIDDEIVDLVRRYAPALVLFPEGRPDEETPYPTGMSDYHPRAVGLFLANARAIPKTYTTVRGVVYFVGAQIRGPARQVARWETPFAWVSSDGQADAHIGKTSSDLASRR